jgi:hypothetical protein
MYFQIGVYVCVCVCVCVCVYRVVSHLYIVGVAAWPKYID